MNPAIRRVGIGILVLFVALIGQLTYLQVSRAERLANDPGNVRIWLRDLSRPRGTIQTADGAIVARSVPSDDQFERQRVYPEGPLFAHVGGYQSIVFGNTGLEATYNDELIGRDIEIGVRNLTDVITGGDIEGDVVLGMSRVAQETARDALGDQQGSVVVLDVRTGGIVALYSNPTYDPNPLAAHDAETVQDVQTLLLADPAKPTLPRAWRERYPAGSTFKIVTTALALDAGLTSPDQVYPRLTALDLPQTNRDLLNFGGKECGGTLAESFRVSCNTTFAQIGLELGELLADGMERFGIGDSPPSDLNPRIAPGSGPEPGSFELDQPSFAQAAIGQGDVAVTPVQMAMIAAAVANDGVMMQPRAGAEVRDPDGVVVRRIESKPWREAMTPATAEAIRTMMVDVVENGTGGGARIPGVQVAGKTGTAQAPGGPPHAWFVGFAPADTPVYAIAVLVERGGNLRDEATGGRVAAPIAAQVLGRLLQG